MKSEKKDLGKFLKRIIIFLSPLLIVFIYLEFHLSLIPNTYSFEKNNLERKRSEIEVLILGSSHAQLDINPQYLNLNSYNLANTSQSLYYDWKLLSQNISYMKKLNMVIISISYNSFEYNLSESPAYSIAFYYDRYFKIPPETEGKNFDLRRYSLVALYGLGDSLKYASESFKVDLVGIDSNGYLDYYKQNRTNVDRISQSAGRRRVEYHHSIMHPQFISKNFQYLENMISLLISKGIKPVIITTPVYHTYYDYLDPHKYQVMQENIQKIQKKYQVKYFNYLKDDRFRLEDFGDNDHLNVEGAKKFSTILNDEVIAPYQKP